MILLNSFNDLEDVISDLQQVIENECENFFNYLESKDCQEINYGDFDLFSGLTGILKYLLYSNQKNILKDIKLLERGKNIFINFINDECLDGKPKFFISNKNMIGNLKNSFKEGGIILGAAHGIASFISVLISLYQRELINEQTLKKSLTLLQKEYTFTLNKNNAFVILNNNDCNYNLGVNNSWCYGLPGILPALLKSLIYSNNLTLREGVKKSLATWNLKEIGNTIDMNSDIFCHGKAGILYSSLLINEFNFETGQLPKILFEELLKDIEYCSFKDTSEIPGEESIVKHGLLVGNLGVYLVLISYIKKERFKEDWVFY